MAGSLEIKFLQPAGSSCSCVIFFMLLVLLRPERRDDEERHDDDRADPEFDDGVEIVNGLAIDDQLRRINKDAVDDILECCATICEQTDNAHRRACRFARAKIDGEHAADEAEDDC